MDLHEILLDRRLRGRRCSCSAALRRSRTGSSAGAAAHERARQRTDSMSPDMYIEKFRAVALGPTAAAPVIRGTRARISATTRRPRSPTRCWRKPRRASPRFASPPSTARFRPTASTRRSSGNVRAVRDAGPRSPEEAHRSGTVTTEYLHVSRTRRRHHTTNAVTIEEPRGIIHSVGSSSTTRRRPPQATASAARCNRPPCRKPRELNPVAPFRRRACAARWSAHHAETGRSGEADHVHVRRRRGQLREASPACSTATSCITQGTITIRADRIKFKQNADNSLSATAFGNPVSFRQKRDGAEGYYEGWAQRAEYDGTRRGRPGTRLRPDARARSTASAASSAWRFP